MIVVTGGGTDHTDLGSLLGIIKNRTPVSEQLDDKELREVVRQELASLFDERNNLEKLLRGEATQEQKKKRQATEGSISEGQGRNTTNKAAYEENEI